MAPYLERALVARLTGEVRGQAEPALGHILELRLTDLIQGGDKERQNVVPLWLEL